MIQCKNGPVHTHRTIQESRECWGVTCHGSLTTPVYPHSHDGATDRQLEYIKTLGGDVDHAKTLSKKGASEYIDQLKATQTGVTVSAAPYSAVPKTKVPVELLNFVPEGYYAVQLDSESPLTFLRLIRPKRGKFAGTTKVQTQHGPNLDLAFVVWPDNRVSVYKASSEESILLMISDYQGSARRYAQKIGKCCRCNAPLTDERSRHYGIGPECEQHWPWMIVLVDEEDAA